MSAAAFTACLQTRNGKMNARAMVVTSVEMFREGIISKDQALLRVNPALLEQLMVPTLAPNAKLEALCVGLPASPGAASGKVVFDADTSEILGKAGEKVILVREETKPEDIHGFFTAQGILTSRGGKTSHAAVVARGMGKPCVSGCDAIHIDVHAKRAKVGVMSFGEGDVITIDGSTGKVYAGRIPTVEAEFFDELNTLLSWADEVATLKVHANADTPNDAARARRFGAVGVGLCRTERMFNDTGRLPIVQEMILAETPEAREAALDKLLPFQRGDFIGIYKAMEGLPVTVRLLDPPIHEFLPTASQLEFEIDHLRGLKRAVRNMHELPESLKLLDPELHRQYVDSLDHLEANLAEYQQNNRFDQLIEKRETMLRKVRALSEVNPMLGHRGVRLGLTNPEIYTMQLRALVEAAAQCVKEGVKVKAEIMVPQVCTTEELKRVKAMLEKELVAVEKTMGLRPAISFGSMIEVVRAVLRAGDIAKEAEFFSFGTNDLTQAAFSFSREDAEKQVPALLSGTRRPQGKPLRSAGLQGRWPLDGNGREVGPRNPAGTQGGHLRRARRSAGLRPLLPPHRSDLCFLLGTTRTDRSSGCRTSQAARIGIRSERTALI